MRQQCIKVKKIAYWLIFALAINSQPAPVEIKQVA